MAEQHDDRDHDLSSVLEAVMYVLFVATIVGLALLIWSYPGFARGDELRETVRLAQEWGAERPPLAWDGTQADLLYGEYIVEVEWGHNRKWYEAIGQALHYAIVYDRRPAIILLRHPSKFSPQDAYRCQSVCAKHGIRLWVVPSKVTDTKPDESN